MVYLRPDGAQPQEDLFRIRNKSVGMKCIRLLPIFRRRSTDKWLYLGDLLVNELVDASRG